jgi:CubicO group peptidase (beta-lactamase class C family)
MDVHKRSAAWLIAALVVSGCGADEAHPPPISGASSGSGQLTSGGSGSGGAGAGGAGSGAGGNDRFAALEAAILAEQTSLGASGVAVAVLEDGEVTFARGYGSKAPGGDDAVSASTLFRVGSVNKMLTATALLQQVAQGKVALDAPVTEYVPAFHFNAEPAWAPSITVRHLLTHASGVADYLEVDVPAAQQTDSALFEFMTNEFGELGYLMVPAGTFYNYSNPNYYLAGLVAEATSGTPYRTLLMQNVFAPLGMDRTYFLADEVLADGDYAVGETTYPGVPHSVQPDSYENAWARPAGYASSSVLDLAKFVQFLGDGDDGVLPPDLRAEMMSEVLGTQEFLDYIHYGHGLFVLNHAFLGSPDEVYPLTIVSHGGDIPGFAADVFYVPSLRLGFVALANADGAHFVQSFVTALRTLTTLPEPEPAPDLTISDASLSAYAGAYYEEFGYGDITIAKSGSSLTISMPVLDQVGIPYEPTLVPIAPDNFYFVVQGVPLPVTFFPDDLGITRYLRTRLFVGVRVDAFGPPPSPAHSLPDGFQRALWEARSEADSGLSLARPPRRK